MPPNAFFSPYFLYFIMLNLFLVSIFLHTYRKGLKIRHFENPYFRQNFTPYGVFRNPRVHKFLKISFLHNLRSFLMGNFWYQSDQGKNIRGNDFWEIALTLRLRNIFFKEPLFFEKNFEFVKFTVAFRRSRNAT